MKIPDLWHLVWFVLVGWLLYQQCKAIAYTPDRSRPSALALTVQFVALALLIDLVLGITLIESVYGSSRSAEWISKSIFAYPAFLVVLVILVWRFVTTSRSQKTQSQKSERKSDP